MVKKANYTQRGSKVESLVASHLEILKKLIVKRLGKEKIYSIILIGGFARGEGSVKLVAGRPKPLLRRPLHPTTPSRTSQVTPGITVHERAGRVQSSRGWSSRQARSASWKNSAVKRPRERNQTYRGHCGACRRRVPKDYAETNVRILTDTVQFLGWTRR